MILAHKQVPFHNAQRDVSSCFPSDTLSKSLSPDRLWIAICFLLQQTDLVALNTQILSSAIFVLRSRILATRLTVSGLVHCTNVVRNQNHHRPSAHFHKNGGYASKSPLKWRPEAELAHMVLTNRNLLIQKRMRDLLCFLFCHSTMTFSCRK